ncbi:hypothetical protein ES705_36020 [subsurface metagenome]
MKDNAGSSTTSNPKQDVVLPGKGNDVPDDKEVVSKLGLLYYLQLIAKSLLYLRGRLGIVLRQTLITKVSQKLVGGLPLR